MPVAAGWPAEERALRAAAARACYERGVDDLATKRPKRAHLSFARVARYDETYRDAARLADRSLEKGLTRGTSTD